LPIGAELLAITAAVATAHAITQSTKIIAKIKWPNDIILNGKKVAGILLESRIIDNKPVYVVGIGINCSQPTSFFENKKLQMPATSIDIETASHIDRNKLATNLINAFYEQLKNAAVRPNNIIDAWRSLSTQLGRRITVKYDKKNFTGNCIGVDPVEGLILQLEKGSVRMFHAAQTRIVKHT
ncbi:MAG: biotin--[acetyl-CoA-carboxylase] ligase, partial [Planctomycetes bacterium]|nr:biotin--[acetyl-CoA-carboxylase] ligase [Planctomycetota bacterium]